MASYSSQIRVNSSTLRQKAAQLRQFNTQLRSKLNALESRENRLAGMWEGDARNAFHNQFNMNKAKFQDFCTLIDKYVIALEEAAAEYDRREAQNVQTAKTK